nr:S-layer homology domain-containing protein [Aneurinibacillus sp. XH2]
MKKSLSLLVAIAMVFSMFASVVSAAEPATTLEKYEFLKGKGVFEGTDGDKPALEENMTRAQFAKVLTKTKGLTEDAAAANVYTDLDGAGWAAGFIGAVTKAKIMDGTWDGIFSPSGEVTIEQLATTLVRALGIAQSDDEVKGVVSDWAKAHVAAALKGGFISEAADYTVPATRAQLVEAIYAAYNKVNVPAELNISDVKAVGAKKIEVSFNKAVEDTSKITLTLSRGANKVTLAEKDGLVWNDAKDKATFTTNVALIEGTYTVKLEAAEGVKLGSSTSKDVSVQAETIKSIKFKSTSDIIPIAKNVTIEFEALNQYGEQSTLPASRFNVLGSNSAVALSAANDKQRITLDTKTPSEGNSPQIGRGSYFSITIIAENGGVSANKNFQIGDTQTAGKVTLKELVLQNGKERLNAGDYAYITYEAYDQYGHPLTDLDTLKQYVQLYSTNPAALKVEFVRDETGDKVPDIRVEASNSFTVDSEITVNAVAIGTGSSSQLKINVASPKTPYEVSFGEFNGTVAIGDVDAKYLPLVVKDQYGATLSADDIVKAYNNTLFVYGASPSATVTLETSGPDKGKIKIQPNESGQKGTVTIHAQIPRSGKNAQTTISVQEKRYPNEIYVSSAMKDQLLYDAKSSLKLKFKDQYGEELKNSKFFTDYKVKTEVSTLSGSLSDIEASALANTVVTNIIDNLNDKEITFKSIKDANSRFNFTAQLLKVENGKEAQIDSVSVVFDTIKAEEAKNLTYEVKKYEKGLYALEDNKRKTVTDAVYNKYVSKLPKVEVIAKNSGGKTVALPDNAVKAVSVSNSYVAGVDNADGFRVYGKNAGKVDVTVEFAPSFVGSYFETLKDVEVSNTAPYIESITASDTKAKKISGTTLNVKDLFGDIKVKDQYGVEFKNEDLFGDAGMFTVSFSASNIEGSGKVTDNKNGTITVEAGVTSFKLTAVTTSGKTVSVDLAR